MLTCKEATHLLSEAQDRKLPAATRLRLEMHLLLCNGCANFKRQMAFLRQACGALAKGGDDGGKDSG